MESLPKQPEQKKEVSPGILMAVHWLKEWIFVPEEPTISSIGEFLLPFLLGGMQACWITAILIGLASADLFESSETLIPLWAPFILILGSLLLLQYLGLRTAKKATGVAGTDIKVTKPETSICFILIGALSLFFVWQHIYSQTAFIFDPKWLLAFFNDILLINGHFYAAATIIGLSFLLGWLGMRLVNRQVEPSDVFRALCLGLGIIIVVVILRTGQASAGSVNHNDVVLLLLIPIFLFIALTAHALARVVFIRKSHPAGLQGSVVAQERAIIMLIGSLGLIFLIVALLLSSIINPTVLQSLAPLWTVVGKAYNWLVVVVANLVVLLATPFFWLVYLYTRLFPSRVQPTTIQNIQRRPKISHVPTSSVALIVPFVKIVLPIVVLLLIFALIWWTLRRSQRVRKRAKRHDQDIHESLWSWSLFWLQLSLMVRAFFARLFHRETAAGESTLIKEEIKGEPAARSIREIYRSLLKKAARRGYPRKKFETPYEFKQRLDEKIPLAEPQLELISELYTSTRYSGVVPDEVQLAQVRSTWVELDQKWT